MKRPSSNFAMAFGLLLLMAVSARAEVTAEQVRKAIDRGTNFLLGQQRNEGGWSEMVAQAGGISALATLALLNAGVEPQDPRMQKALKYLRGIRPERTYVVSLQTMVFARAEPDRDRDLILRNVRWLESTQITEGPANRSYKGAWSYPGLGGGGDNSNSQFALLALYEAERVGVAASERTWNLAKNYWEKAQNADGSWGYNWQANSGTGSMTCAGMTSLVIAADRIQSVDARAIGDHVECCGGRRVLANDPIDRALDWLGKRYSVERNPGTGGGTWHLYYLYGLERVGRLTAKRFLPLAGRPGQPTRADWYRQGAERLISKQDSLSGFWKGSGHSEDNPVVATSFALLFLSKGRWPVLVGKLEHDQEDWNRHRGDVANLTRYVESRWKRDMTWQVIDPQLATVDDLAQTPVLYLCGSRSPLPEAAADRKELAAKLRDYLDRGGFLLAEAYCGGSGFDRGFRALMREVFPEPEYALRLLEPEHPIWYAEEQVDPRQARPIWGVDFGCRTSVVYLPIDPPNGSRPSLSCLWELSRPGRGATHSAAVQAQVDAALSLGINILAYATNRELKSKEDFFRPPTARQPGDQAVRGRLYVATLRHPGGCKAAPRAVINLMESATAELKIRTSVRKDLLDMTDDALFDYHLVFMHGRTAFRLTDRERQQLKLYLERGGMLLSDSICASPAFSESFRREMAAILPDRKLQPIGPKDPLLSTTYGGFDLQRVSRRDPQAAAPGKPLSASIRQGPPDLEGIKFDDRWGVVFSPYDLSCALENHDSLECRGYLRDDAARIGLNVVLYSLQQ
jgi:hypothetical protein